MGRYRGARCKLSRREKYDLELTSGVKHLNKKCDMNNTPGMHGTVKKRLSNYGIQLREKQKVKRIYGITERQFRNTYKSAKVKSGSTGVNLLQLLEIRLDNIVYRLGFAVTRAEARQLVSHKHILVNSNVLNIPSYNVKINDLISLHDNAIMHLRVKNSLQLFKEKEKCTWLEITDNNFQGKIQHFPERSELAADINEQLIVEFYSK
jgi:small subunit ribosomal protein S4